MTSNSDVMILALYENKRKHRQEQTSVLSLWHLQLINW